MRLSLKQKINLPPLHCSAHLASMMPTYKIAHEKDIIISMLSILNGDEFF